MSAPPTLLHDPTSEPSRAVHWFCLEASIPIEVKQVFLTRNDHLSEEFLAVNPRHQVPALSHGDLRLSEATAIIRYLAELNGHTDRWLGRNLQERARINMLLSWYHTNLRLKVTLNYFLPVLLAPAYISAPRPSATEVATLRGRFAETLGQLDAFLVKTRFLAGEAPTVPDLLFASELFALDVDPERRTYLDCHRRLTAWLDRVRRLGHYQTSHCAWNAVIPLMRARLTGDIASSSDPSWVAECCERVQG
jgi:glutathione S-transferase